MNRKIPINVTIDHGSLNIPVSPIFQKEKNTYLCPFCVTKLKKFEYECSDCHRKMDWSRSVLVKRRRICLVEYRFLPTAQDTA